MSVQIDVVQGTLEGKLCSYKGKPYYSFEGIPYAKPPTGKLRFRVSVNLSLLLINILLISAINKKYYKRNNPQRFNVSYTTKKLELKDLWVQRLICS